MLNQTIVTAIANADLIITHPGSAHLDDFFSCAAVQYIREYTGQDFLPIERREPTEEELRDPKVVVIDVGRSDASELLNFDHHQYAREAAPACSLTLLCEALGVDDVLRSLFPWYSYMATIDSKGPMVAANSLGLEKLPPELNNPLVMAILKRFSAAEKIPSDDTFILPIMLETAKFVDDRAEELVAKIE